MLEACCVASGRHEPVPSCSEALIDASVRSSALAAPLLERLRLRPLGLKNSASDALLATGL